MQEAGFWLKVTMLPPAVDEAAASSGLRSSVRRRLGLHQRPFGVLWAKFGLPESNPHATIFASVQKTGFYYS